MSTLHDVTTILKEFDRAAPKGTQGALVASTDGFLIADTLRRGDAERVAAMVATTTGVSRRMCDTLDAGGLCETTIAGDDEQVLAYSLGDMGVLAVVAERDANVALLHVQARETVEGIRDALGPRRRTRTTGDADARRCVDSTVRGVAPASRDAPLPSREHERISEWHQDE